MFCAPNAKFLRSNTLRKIRFVDFHVACPRRLHNATVRVASRRPDDVGGISAGYHCRGLCSVTDSLACCAARTLARDHPQCLRLGFYPPSHQCLRLGFRRFHLSPRRSRQGGARWRWAGARQKVLRRRRMDRHPRSDRAHRPRDRCVVSFQPTIAEVDLVWRQEEQAMLLRMLNIDMCAPTVSTIFLTPFRWQHGARQGDVHQAGQARCLRHHWLTFARARRKGCRRRALGGKQRQGNESAIFCCIQYVQQIAAFNNLKLFLCIEGKEHAARSRQSQKHQLFRQGLSGRARYAGRARQQCWCHGDSLEGANRRWVRKADGCVCLSLSLSLFQSIVWLVDLTFSKYTLMNVHACVRAGGVVRASVVTIGEMTGINHFGHFHLTSLLMPQLKAAGKATGDARIVNLSSQAHQIAFDGMNFDDLQSQALSLSFSFCLSLPLMFLFLVFLFLSLSLARSLSLALSLSRSLSHTNTHTYTHKHTHRRTTTPGKRMGRVNSPIFCFRASFPANSRSRRKALLCRHARVRQMCPGSQ